MIYHVKYSVRNSLDKHEHFQMYLSFLFIPPDRVADFSFALSASCISTSMLFIFSLATVPFTPCKKIFFYTLCFDEDFLYKNMYIITSDQKKWSNLQISLTVKSNQSIPIYLGYEAIANTSRKRKPLARLLLLDQGRYNESLIRASKYTITK